jgi:Ankyrin repeats (3 copies)
MKTEADIEGAMRALPTTTLNDLYEEEFTRMSKSGQHSQSYAMQVFSMLLCTQEALSPEAVIQAIAEKSSEQRETLTLARIIDICFNLVVLDSELNVLRFAHISFQEFLETKSEFAPHHVHRIAARNCLDFCLEGFQMGMEINLSPKDNFHHYSAVYWAEHCRNTIFDGAEDLITSKMQQFVFDGGDVALGFVDWIQEVNKFTKNLPNDHALAKELNSVIHSVGSPLFTACVFGLGPIIDDLANAKDYHWNLKNDLGSSGLYLAAAAGHRTIVQSLLQHEVYVNDSGGKFGHPLHAACFGGHASIVELLLDHGADPKLGPRSALEYALLADHEDVALLLLDAKFDVSD